MVNWKLKEASRTGANLRTDFEGDMPYSGTMDPQSKRKTSTSAALTAGETKTSLMRQEMNSGKGGKNKWSWKEREDDMRELERKSIEQKREVQKLKKLNDTTKVELDELKEKVASSENEIAQIIASGHYQDHQGNNYVFLQDTVVKQQEDDVAMLKAQIEKLQKENTSFQETSKTHEEEKKALSEEVDKLVGDKERLDASILDFSKYKETAHASITRLKKVNETTDAAFTLLTKDKEKTDASIIEFTKEKDTADALITRLTEEKQKADDTITQLTKDIHTKDATITEITNDKVNADASTTQVLKDKDTAIASITKFTEDMQTAEATITQLTGDKIRITKEKENADDTITQLTKDKQTADAMVTQLTKDKATADASITQLLEDKENGCTSITKLTEEKLIAEATITQLTTDKAIADASITQFLKDKEITDASIGELSKEKELLESSSVETEKSIEIQKLEFEEATKDLENKLLVKEKETSEIENKKEEVLNQLNEVTEAKKLLELELEIKNGNLGDQLKTIDDLSKTILARDTDIRNKLEELGKSQDECNMLQESNNCIENEHEMFITDILSKLDEITKILQAVEYDKKPEDVTNQTDATNYPGSLGESIPEIIINHNEDTLDEELNQSDGSDRASIKSNSDWVIPKFEEVKNLLLQKIGDIDNLLSDKDFQNNKSTFQLEEWKINCETIKEEANTMKVTLEGLLELKDKEIHAVRDQNEIITTEYNNTKLALENSKQSQIVGLETSDAYYREQIDTVKADMEKISKDHETTLSEHNENIEALKGESNYLKNDIVLKDRELTELTRKHESFISQMDEKEKELREEHETYLAEEVTRIQNEYKGKLAEIKEENEGNLTRLTQEYEDKLMDVEVAYEKLKLNDSESLHEDYTRQLGTVSSHCSQLIDDRNAMETLLNTSKAALEEELQNAKDSLISKIRELDLLQAKFDAQHRLVEFVTTSLEQERAKKSDSNSEILTILEKLEKQFSDTFSTPNELYASKNSINSFASESLPGSLISNRNPLELNTTWPPKYKRAVSPIRRWSSLSTLEQDQEKRKDLIERLRSEISVQLNGMSNNYSPPYKPYLTKPQVPWSNATDERDGGERISPFDQRSAKLSSNNTPYDRGVSPTLSLRTRLLKNKISLDSGLDQHDENELISYPNQVHNVTQMFMKLDEQHEKLKEENLGSLDKQWSVELDNWKNRIQYKITDLQPPSEKEGSVIATIATSAIIFHPDDNEVQAIIENANKMYDSTHFLL